MVKESDIQQAESAILDYIEDFFDILGEHPGLTVEYHTKDELYINLEGESGFFSDDRDALAESLGVLSEVFLKRRYGSDKEVQIDLNGVKLTRRKKLEKFAVEAANRAIDNGRKIRLNPMTPEERKWVHISLAEIDGVDTYSVNEGEERRVIIKPTN